MTRAQAQALRLVPPDRVPATRFCDRPTCAVPRPHRHPPRLPTAAARAADTAQLTRDLVFDVEPPPAPSIYATAPAPPVPQRDPLDDVYRAVAWSVRDQIERANGGDLAPVFAAVREGVRLVRRRHPLLAPEDDAEIGRVILAHAQR